MNVVVEPKNEVDSRGSIDIMPRPRAYMTMSKQRSHPYPRLATSCIVLPFFISVRPLSPSAFTPAGPSSSTRTSQSQTRGSQLDSRSPQGLVRSLVREYIIGVDSLQVEYSASTHEGFREHLPSSAGLGLSRRVGCRVCCRR